MNELCTKSHAPSRYLKRNIRAVVQSIVLTVPGLSVFSGCTKSLPENDPQAAVIRSYDLTEQARRDAAESAEQARSAHHKSEALLTEARELLSQALKAQTSCKADLERLKKTPAKRTVITIKQKSAPLESLAPHGEPVTPPGAAPDYSPSDAPLAPAHSAAAPAAEHAPAGHGGGHH